MSGEVLGWLLNDEEDTFRRTRRRGSPHNFQSNRNILLRTEHVLMSYVTKRQSRVTGGHRETDEEVAPEK